jgi:predicted small lipoprotein YifL
MRILACVILVFCLSACGQKGPLFLPNEAGSTTEDALPAANARQESVVDQKTNNLSTP